MFQVIKPSKQGKWQSRRLVELYIAVLLPVTFLKFRKRFIAKYTTNFKLYVYWRSRSNYIIYWAQDLFKHFILIAWKTEKETEAKNGLLKTYFARLRTSSISRCALLSIRAIFSS